MASKPTTDPIAFANRLADASGAVIGRYFRRPVDVDLKADDSPVTAADREAELAMRALIEEAYPDHGIIGEEHEPVRPAAEHVWVLDPIDGTRAFLTGQPLFGTLIAFVRRGAPVLGVIDHPITGERWVGAAGKPSTLNGEPVRVRRCAGLDEAVLYAPAHDCFTGADLEAFTRLCSCVAMIRYGDDCYAYALLATGFVDLVVENDMRPHDYLALVPVIEGAGGVITDWQGAPLTLRSDGRVLAAGDGAAHAAALARLAGEAELLS